MSRTINSEMIHRLLALGLKDSDTLILAAEFIERRPNGFHDLNCIVSGFEADPAGFGEVFPKVLRSLLPVEPERREPANDRTPRMSSEQRRCRYASLVERDGPFCSDCGCQEGVLWRQMGVWSSDFGRYTKVHPTSNLEVDHRTPLWAGGDNSLPNLWLLCVDCHKKKTAIEAGQRRRA